MGFRRCAPGSESKNQYQGGDPEQLGREREMGGPEGTLVAVSGFIQGSRFLDWSLRGSGGHHLVAFL